MGKDITEDGTSTIESIGPKTKMTLVIVFYSWCQNLEKKEWGGGVLHSDNSRIFEKKLF
jgi:hypothetical protein